MWHQPLLLPLAEAYLRSMITGTTFSQIVSIESRGAFSGRLERPAERRAREVATAHGLSLDGHCTREFALADFDSADQILAFDEDSYRHLQDLGGTGQKGKVELFRKYVGNITVLEIPDPILGEGTFEEMWELIDKGTRGLFEELRRRFG